jgi:hypothetical protein
MAYDGTVPEVTPTPEVTPEPTPELTPTPELPADRDPSMSMPSALTLDPGQSETITVLVDKGSYNGSLNLVYQTSYSDIASVQWGEFTETSRELIVTAYNPGTVDITITYNTYKKNTTMIYDAEIGKYTYNQYNKLMQDQITAETEAFENVVVMEANITANGIYQVADFVAGGTGYFACGGKIIPITWTCEGEHSPFRFFTADGQPLSFGQGNTYIAVTQPASSVVWTA